MSLENPAAILVDVSGTALATPGNPLRTDPTGTTTQPVQVSNFPVSQAVTGAFFQATQPVSATSLPLPTGAALDATVAAVTTSLGGDGGETPAAGTGVRGWLRSISDKLNAGLTVDGTVAISGSVAVTGTFWQTTQPISGTVAVSNLPATQPISAISLPLPTGAATSALQTTGNGYLQSIVGQLPAALGGQTIANSLAVNIASDQTVPVSGTFFQSTQPVSISGTVPVSGTFWQSLQPVSVSNFPATQPISGSVSVSNFPVSQAVTGTFFQSTQPISGSVSVSNFPATQPISAISLPLPTGAATSALQTTISGQLPTTLGAKTTANSLAVNIASDQTVPVSGTITANAGTGTFAISAASLPLPASAATSALQTAGNATLTAISGQLPATLGGKTTANSVAVNIASDQTVPVSGTFFQATQPISGNVGLNTARTTSTLSHSAINFSASGANTVVAGVMGQTIRVYRIFFVVGGATNITCQDGATALTGTMPILANGSFVLDLDSEPWFVTSSGNGFIINSSAAVQVSGTVYYTQS